MFVTPIKCLGSCNGPESTKRLLISYVFINIRSDKKLSIGDLSWLELPIPYCPSLTVFRITRHSGSYIRFQPATHFTTDETLLSPRYDIANSVTTA